MPHYLIASSDVIISKGDSPSTATGMTAVENAADWALGGTWDGTTYTPPPVNESVIWAWAIDLEYDDDVQLNGKGYKKAVQKNNRKKMTPTDWVDLRADYETAQ